MKLFEGYGAKDFLIIAGVAFLVYVAIKRVSFLTKIAGG